MKKIAKYTAIAALAIGFAGCNDSFLDKAPTTTISEVTAFESYKSTQPICGHAMPSSTIPPLPPRPMTTAMRRYIMVIGMPVTSPTVHREDIMPMPSRR